MQSFHPCTKSIYNYFLNLSFISYFIIFLLFKKYLKKESYDKYWISTHLNICTVYIHSTRMFLFQIQMELILLQDHPMQETNQWKQRSKGQTKGQNQVVMKVTRKRGKFQISIDFKTNKTIYPLTDSIEILCSIYLSLWCTFKTQNYLWHHSKSLSTLYVCIANSFIATVSRALKWLQKGYMYYY